MLEDMFICYLLGVLKIENFHKRCTVGKVDAIDFCQWTEESVVKGGIRNCFISKYFGKCFSLVPEAKHKMAQKFKKLLKML